MSFDPYDKSCWYFGSMSRQDATNILMSENESGVFLVRNSTTIVGDLVLCVKEGNKVSHYIINKIQQGDDVRFRIGDQMFPDVPSLLHFYKQHFLDFSTLIRPATRKFEKVRAKFDFHGSGDADDLPFKKGDILTVISRDEEHWWTAKNTLGHTGSIPVPYVEAADCESDQTDNGTNGSNQPSQTPAKTGNINIATNQQAQNQNKRGSDVSTKYMAPNNVNQRKLPALAKVKQARVPNAYDKTALKLQVGDIINVTKTNINGQWEGELNGKVGHFPFTHVEFLDTEFAEQQPQDGSVSAFPPIPTNPAS